MPGDASPCAVHKATGYENTVDGHPAYEYHLFQMAWVDAKALPERKPTRGEIEVRISSNPRVMGGKPTLRGTRVTASTIAGLLATGHSEAEVLALYPYLEADDIRAVERWTKEQEAARRPAGEVGSMADPALVLRLTPGELYDLQEGLDAYGEERLESYRTWLKLGSRYEAAFALRDYRSVGRLFREIEKRAVAEETP